MFALHSMASLLMWYMHAIFSLPELSFDAEGRPTGQAAGSTPSTLGRFIMVYMDYILIYGGANQVEHKQLV